MPLKEYKYKPYDLDEYIREGEPCVRERGLAWQTAIGLQEVDGLHTSNYLMDTARRHIEGEITIAEAHNLIDTYYKTSANRSEVKNDRTEEADKVSARITELLSERSFSMASAQLIAIHRHLFHGIYNHAGLIRNYNITKKEWVLRGETVLYSSYYMISDNLEHDLQQEKEFSYTGLNIDNAIQHLTRFCSNLWQIHAFGEGNTRTTAVFMIKYLRKLGFNVTNDVFAKHSWYFRNALVRANYTNLNEGITETTIYLERFFRKMILGEPHPLRNRELHLDWKEDTDKSQSAIHQSANSTAQSATNENQSANTFSLKCKNYTIDQIAVLRIIQVNPSATQKQIAEEIGKSERTVKAITSSLSHEGIIVRINGKRNGFWKIK